MYLGPDSLYFLINFLSDGFPKNFNNKKNILVNERDTLVNQISLLPRKQQDFINFTREVEINSKIVDVDL